MKRLIRITAPADTSFAPMTFTRQPVVHRFWLGGLVLAFVGFFFGFFLWMWQHDQLPIQGDFFLIRLWHARVQIEGFLGSFLMGFALQSGPHITGGKPPPSSSLLKLPFLLWIGLFLSLFSLEWLALIGMVLISMAYGGAGYFLWQVTRQGNPRFQIPRGYPLAAGMALMAAAPWLSLDDPNEALFLLWCGPVTMAMVAGQQLIQNVLGGRLLQDRPARLLVITLALAWLFTALAGLTPLEIWPMAGAAWLITLFLFLHGTHFFAAAWRNGLSSINVTLTLGFLHVLMAAGWLVTGEGTPDVAVHLLGVGSLTTLIIGVTVRVAGFFSAGAVMGDRVALWLLLLWAGVAWMRSFFPVWAMPERLTLWVSLAGALILGFWGMRTAGRLMKIHTLVPVNLGGSKPDG
ncbi:MAG: NnrS family protein [Magnetococcales bacterium]|nr:NnrS family protein [Magnetococcales bacterium]